MNSFNKYFWDVIQNNYVNFKGVSSRKQYWMFILWKFLLIILPLFILPLFILVSIWGVTSFLSSAFLGDYTSIPSIFPLLVSLFSIFAVVVWIGCILPSVGISVRRLHDIGFSGWLLLLGIIPCIGVIIIFIFHLLPSKPLNNKYLKDCQVSDNGIDIIARLYSLKEKGVLTEEEFNKQKKQILK